MKFTNVSVRAGAGCLFAGIAAATVVAPIASAAPDCSPAGVQNTVNSSIGAAEDYLAARPEANTVVRSALFGPNPSGDLRAYFTANPGQYYDLRGILAPIGESQQVCGTTGLSPQLSDAYNQFVAG
ncbi:MAG: hemophore-related protein [Mycobacterium sp.]